MREVWRMWNYSTMVVLTVLTAGTFAAILIPFKGIPLIPGLTELRPANVIPVVFGLLFGPAGAWAPPSATGWAARPKSRLADRPESPYVSIVSHTYNLENDGFPYSPSPGGRGLGGGG